MQLDDRYFNGLEGQYTYALHFLLKKEEDPSTDYICRVRPAHPHEHRSVSCEVFLEPGRYEVLPKITATRDTDKPTFQKLIKQFAEKKPQKLRQVGMQYDLAHAKGGIPDEDQKILEQKLKEKAKKREKKTSTKVTIEIDIPASLKADVTEQSDSSDKGKAKAEDKETAKPPQDGEIDEFEDAAETLKHDEAQKTDAKDSEGVKRDQEQKAEAVGEQGPNKATNKAEEVLDKDKNPVESKEKDNEEKSEAKKEEKASEDEGKEDTGTDETSEEEDEDDEDESRWNAVCVACLRVYSQDPALTITLVQRETADGVLTVSSSLVQGQEPAGATQ